jgi:hypothetical protein
VFTEMGALGLRTHVSGRIRWGQFNCAIPSRARSRRRFSYAPR